MRGSIYSKKLSYKRASLIYEEEPLFFYIFYRKLFSTCQKREAYYRQYFVALLASLLNEFYSCELPCFPVLEAEPLQVKPQRKVRGKQKQAQTLGKLLGFLTRKDLDLWVSDLERLGSKHKYIPKEILNNRLSPTEVLRLLPTGQSIPVFNSAGLKVASWSENELIQAMGQLPKQPSLEVLSHPQTLKESKGKRQEPSGVFENSHWLASLLLRAFPWPLYACDLQGKTLFFNSLFEERILKKAKLKNSLQHTEKYLIELMRDLLAQSFIEDPQRKGSHRTLSAYDSFLSHYIRIVNLEEKGRVHGYFFVFQEGGDPGFTAEVNCRLASGNSLDQIMDEIEGRMIFQALGNNGQNISHTAKALGIKRSTLQNKIQRLKIEKRFGPIQEGPIRRHRSSETKKEKAAQEAAVKKSKSKVKSKAKTISTREKALPKKKTLTQNKAQAKKKTSSKVVDKQKKPIKKKASSLVLPQNKKNIYKVQPQEQEIEKIQEAKSLAQAMPKSQETKQQAKEEAKEEKV